ncbi:MAG TPA: UPF0182 family protein [Acidimicrobiales bacterium]|nr:UPF0182 family protein [Acidimicrobiales bacterium]
MKAPADFPKRSRRATRGRIIIIAVIVVFVLITSLRSIASFYTDYLWFQELKFTSVFRGVLVVQVLLAVVFCVLFFALLLGNLIIADRIAPRFRPAGPEDELVQRYREAVGPHASAVRIVVAVVFALFTGIGTRSQWNNWILFRNATSFHVKDPQFGRDVGFYVFQLPFIKFFVDWLFVAIIITLIVTLVFHYLNGGIRVQSPVQRVTPQVKAHISVLLGALALVKAVGYWFERFELTLSTKHVVEGATYTSVHADLPAKTLLIVIAVFAAALFIYNIYQKGWTLPIIAVGLWGLVWVLVGGIYPAVIQALRVSPAEIVREKPYIQRNIVATRTAYSLNNVHQQQFSGVGNLTAADFTPTSSNTVNLTNVRLLDPAFIKDAFNKLQEIRSYYQFNDLDVDRYTLGGAVPALTQTLTAVREINSADVPSGFVNQHLLYTHGLGAAMSPANQSGVNPTDGTPNFVMSDVPPQSTGGAPVLDPNGAKVYYGENQGNYVIVDSAQPELDYQDKVTGANVLSKYTGTGGVPMGSIFRRLAFALRFGDPNPVISGLVTSNSRILYVRAIGDRVRKAAPFLKYDSDPYATVVNGKIYWIQDAYTVTSRYPYAQTADTGRLLPASGLNTDFNYVRNSVKVVIDAYNGSMKFYVMDQTDPIIQTYEKAFPELFTPGSKMDPALKAHIRYPEDLFRVQTNMYGRYHLTNPNDFYTQANAWTISQDPGSGPPSNITQNSTALNAAGQVVSTRRNRMQPVYELLTLPGQQDQAFTILQPFVPVSASDKQQNLTAFMTAKGDPGNYGSLDVFVTPAGQQVDGPALINAAINANPDISKEITLLNTNGSQVELGNVVTVPVNQSIIYVQPLYVQAQGNPVPRLDDVIVVYNGAAYHGGTLYSALCSSPFGSSFCSLNGGTAPPPNGNTNGGTTNGGTTPTTTAPPGGTTTTVPGAATIQQLLADASMHFQNADNALKQQPPNLGVYQSEVAQAEADITRAQQLSGTSSTTTTTGPPTATTVAPATTTTAPHA